MSSVEVEWEPIAREALLIMLRKSRCTLKRLTCVFCSNGYWSSWQASPDLMQKFERNRAKERKIELKIKKQAERNGEVQHGGRSKWERCVVESIKTKPPAFFKLSWTLNHFRRGKYGNVIFCWTPVRAPLEVKTERRSWAKRTKSVCCFSACWSWVESNLSVLFCATLEVCGGKSFKDEVKGSVRNSHGPVPCLIIFTLAPQCCRMKMERVSYVSDL